jgi:hypothetical protein
MPARRTPTQTHLATVAASRALLTLGAVASAAAALAAAAPVRRAPQHRTPAPQDDVDRVLRAAGATGPGRAVWAWNPAFAAGDPGAEPLLRTFTWVAPTGGDGAPLGTVTARQIGEDARSVTVNGTDDDADLSRALGTLAPDEVLVRAGRDWVAVRGDRVRPLLPGGPAASTGGRTVTEHRAVLREQAAHGGVPGDRSATHVPGAPGRDADGD